MKVINKFLRIPIFLYRYFRCELSSHLWRYEQREPMSFHQLSVVLSGQRCVYCGLTYEKFKAFGGWLDNEDQVLITRFQPSASAASGLTQIQPLNKDSA